MKIREIKTYKFNELTDKQKEKALEKYYNINTDHEWWDCEFEDFKTIASLMGIKIDNIYFAGFSSQGDGACFTGNYSYEKQAIKKVKEYAPQDTELHRIAGQLQEIQKRHLYLISATIKHNGHYYHELCTDIDVVDFNGYSIAGDDFDNITELLRDLMRWMYSQLDKQYNYLVSEKEIEETLIANEYDFTTNGEIF